MRVLLLLWLVPTLLLSGCTKSSPEFYKLESQQSLLVSREGDDAWINPEMDAIVVSLQAIPSNALEKPRAAALIQKIAAEQTRVQAERVKPPPRAPVNPFAGRYPTPSSDRVVEGAPSEDAGPAPAAQPWSGMDEKAFVAGFGKCFSSGPKAALPDGQPASSFVLSAGSECQKQHGAKGAVTSYLFTDAGLWGKSTETTEVRDAGIILLPGPPSPQSPPSPAPLQPIFTTPGAPLPEGYENPR